jgi:predicted anti-sigma-YlaC factor YlaD
MMTCHECQKHLVGYIHNELKPHLRRRVAYHLDDCPACYAVYGRQRELARELQLTIPLIGRGDTPRFDHVWASIQIEMNQPRRSAASNWYQFRYGLAMMAAMLVLLFPWVVGGRRDLTLAAPPTQPAPLSLTAVQTAGVTASGAQGTAIALSVTVNQGAATPEAKPGEMPVSGATAAPANEDL